MKVRAEGKKNRRNKYTRTSIPKQKRGRRILEQNREVPVEEREREEKANTGNVRGRRREMMSNFWEEKRKN